MLVSFATLLPPFFTAEMLVTLYCAIVQYKLGFAFVAWNSLTLTDSLQNEIV